MNLPWPSFSYQTAGNQTSAGCGVGVAVAVEVGQGERVGTVDVGIDFDRLEVELNLPPLMELA